MSLHNQRKVLRRFLLKSNSSLFCNSSLTSSALRSPASVATMASPCCAGVRSLPAYVTKGQTHCFSPATLLGCSPSSGRCLITAASEISDSSRLLCRTALKRLHTWKLIHMKTFLDPSMGLRHRWQTVEASLSSAAPRYPTERALVRCGRRGRGFGRLPDARTSCDLSESSPQQHRHRTWPPGRRGESLLTVRSL